MRVKSADKQLIFEESLLFENCHASTLIALDNGDILVAWFGGTREGDPDVDIWCSRRHGGIWSTPIKVAGEDGLPHWNPVLFRGDNGVIHLYYKVGHDIPSWYTRTISSLDNGLTWCEPKILVDGDVGGRGPVKNKPIILTDGSWLAPASIENEVWDSFVDVSIDKGETWEASGFIKLDRQGKGIIQPTIWESVEGRVHMFLRSTAGYVYRSDSEDSGRTWSPAHKTNLPNNNSGIDLVKLSDKTLALVFNPVSGDWAARTPLIVRFSKDNGFTWGDEFILEDGPGEYSYPAIISSDNRILITYTWQRKNIAFWEIAVDDDLVFQHR